MLPQLLLIIQYVLFVRKVIGVLLVPMVTQLVLIQVPTQLPTVNTSLPPVQPNIVNIVNPSMLSLQLPPVVLLIPPIQTVDNYNLTVPIVKIVGLLIIGTPQFVSCQPRLFQLL